MTQKTIEKLNQEVSVLKREVKSLRSLIAGIIKKDREGEYRPEFVKKVLRLSKKEGNFKFQNSKSFIEQIKSGS